MDIGEIWSSWFPQPHVCLCYLPFGHLSSTVRSQFHFRMDTFSSPGVGKNIEIERRLCPILNKGGGQYSEQNFIIILTKNVFCPVLGAK